MTKRGGLFTTLTVEDELTACEVDLACHLAKLRVQEKGQGPKTRSGNNTQGLVRADWRFISLNHWRSFEARW